MKVETLRFGPIRVSADEVVRFPAGLLGMEDCRDWVVMLDPDRPLLAWLQSVDRPEVALAVVSPRRFVPGYQLRLARREWTPLGLDSASGAEVLTIVAQNEGRLSLNLKAPLVINVESRLGRQVVNGGDWPVRQTIADGACSVKKIA